MKKYRVRVDITTFQHCYVDVIASNANNALDYVYEERMNGTFDEDMSCDDEQVEACIISSEEYDNGLQTNL